MRVESSSSTGARL